MLCVHLQLSEKRLKQEGEDSEIISSDMQPFLNARAFKIYSYWTAVTLWSYCFQDKPHAAKGDDKHSNTEKFSIFKPLAASRNSTSQERSVRVPTWGKESREATSLEEREIASSEIKQSDPAEQTRGQDYQYRLDRKNCLPSTGVITSPDACIYDVDSSVLDGLQDVSRTCQGIGFASSCQVRSEPKLPSTLSRSRSPAANALDIRQRNTALAKKAKGSLSKAQPQQGFMSSPRENQGSNIGNQAKLRLPMGSESFMQYTLDLQRKLHGVVCSATLHNSGACARSLQDYNYCMPPTNV